MHESIYADWTLLLFALGFFMISMKFVSSQSERENQRRVDERREFGDGKYQPPKK